MVILLAGSAICTGAPTSAYGVLVFGRSIQGIGVAGVNICVRTILADRVSLAEYAVNWTIFIFIAGVGFGTGPVLGGYLAQASWRWCFAINLPIASMSILLAWYMLRHELIGPQPLDERQCGADSTFNTRLCARLSTIDFGGQMLFLWGFGLLSLALTWGGGKYAWSSKAVLVPLVLGVVLSLAWLAYEYSLSHRRFASHMLQSQKPMLPWKLLSHRNGVLLFLINFGIGIAMFAVLYFMDLYFALVDGRSPQDAGVTLLLYLPGAGSMSNPKSPIRNTSVTTFRS